MEEEGSVPVAAWLAALHLEQYVSCFQRRELRTVRDCRALTEQSLTQLGVLLPGHRRRILLGLQKAFAEGTPPGAPVLKPVPMKRHVFRRSTAVVPEHPEHPEHPQEHPKEHSQEHPHEHPEYPKDHPQEHPEHPKHPKEHLEHPQEHLEHPQEHPKLTELDQGTTLTHHPPPIPPRVGCRPPLKFSASLKGGSPEPPPSAPPAPRGGSPPLRPPLPPLPAKRHQLEAKGQAPQAPPELPPRAAFHRSTPGKEGVPITERPPPAPPLLLPCSKPLEPPPKASVPFVPQFDDSDYEDSASEEELTGAVGGDG
ncbi:arf-GAP with Rho-GAP domain, ANK repeat and PH domain-containing protein 1-like [Melopsittacus undulatus]|uniref:arf-GAP with Rho-GAP domain, ANK repeat and PH domain-containing protein 1-like n=1 Tax=Melopsittacus undulatus TaxID=13146 RepID=UPI00146CF978|nr:arf-GAP with Rho-GAP domain, ANK repeat and PH domain-containing protein 1-like [Melopsittacus undulatus]